MKNIKIKYVIYCFVFFSSISIILLTGCQNGGNKILNSKTNLVWPKPPETPRIRYIGSISKENDLRNTKSFIQKISEFIFGEKKVGFLVSPYALAVDQDDKLYVTDTASGTVHVFDLRKSKYRQFGKMTDTDNLQGPVGIALSSDRIYVVDSILHEVCVFDKKGKYIFSFGSQQLIRPSGITYREADKTVFVTDTGSHKILSFTFTGQFIKEIGSRGVVSGMFNFPTHMWKDQAGKFYVSDTLNYRIQVFDNQWVPQAVFGQQGDRPGNFAHPCGIATDSYGNIYVTDRQYENVQIFNAQGQILLAFGEEGTQTGQFWLPSGICIDRYNRIYVADSYNKRIQIFEIME